ncbi:bifunctional indole-3-glycerol-phosphate synthase TrpC/phosphoribosylanthranilate isomerase TrpF [Candidatus Sodalis endolongispinus]|uniref:Multifunctional fusion protein n=1 Tax=Candidatus Sodalis endolongispinus TaxID=2812662 RepID=A0ABS5YE11_9GAMM|nr:bifunctional indole-3-glycerol-phosphate synthase TrpC/phosphoribosylanthranilate isomerase TrpF [Candidatus Sodalis endolongispinus]MBT9433246.1 bifunctional indole-3-glycerol-phosphate synthase TrpC/phosphoribosylanthranilate isomerase TrpF [Candidatus Sodalis endolongispinus]
MKDTVLAKIVADKYEWVAGQQRLKPLDSFRHQVAHSTRSFYHALSGTRTAFILECKKASPSKGLIRADFDPVAIAGVYRHYAAAISVLTDEKYFQGSFDYLLEVSRSVSQPVLCKDFIVDPWQIYFARLHQADAVLLMLSVLDDDTYRALAAVAHSLNMGVLTEVISDEERERAIALEAKVVGINNRDLRDLSIDLNRTRTLGPRLPAGVTVISESGINHYRQVRELSHYANGFLIGSALMSEPDLTMAVRRVILGENKVCGLTRAVDARAALEAGAIYGGLIFVPGSPRCVDIDTARTVIAGAALRYVGVFRDAPVADVAATARALSLAAVQLHGDEDQRYIDALRHALPPECSIWKALDMRHALPARDLAQVDRYVLDNGGGNPFDWSLLNGDTLDDVMLAGGLAADNCVAAARLGCVGLDFNSDVESAPGIKDHHKLATVFQTLRAY